jgi:gamma-butyrobetaine dioxygenase
LADHQSQQRALDRLCAEVPSLRTALAAATEVLCREGAVIIEAVPTDDSSLVIAAKAMGVASTEDNGSPNRLVWDVRPGSASPMVRSQLPDAFPLHTDSAHLEHPHAVVGLACVAPSQDGGGLSLLAPASLVMDVLRAEGWEQEACLLQHPCFPFASVSEDGRPVQLRAILSVADCRVEVRYRQPLLRWGLQLSPRPLKAAYAGALKALNAVLQRPSLPTRLLLEADDFLLFDNRRTLHGRTAMGPGSSRHLKRLKLHEPGR